MQTLGSDKKSRELLVVVVAAISVKIVMAVSTVAFRLRLLRPPILTQIAGLVIFARAMSVTNVLESLIKK